MNQLLNDELMVSSREELAIELKASETRPAS